MAGVRTIYATTKPTFFDTKAIAKAKMLQQLESPSTASAGLLAYPSTTDNEYRDTEVITLQKILVALQ